MVELDFEPCYQNIVIECEKESIDYYAKEMGFFKALLEKIGNDESRQWFNYFINYSLAEMERANARLTKYREQITRYEIANSEEISA